LIPHVYSYRCADWLNVQTFDYRGSRDKIAEHHSALMQATSAEGDDKDLNQVCRIIYQSSITYSDDVVASPNCEICDATDLSFEN
jgi:acetyltransferase-like isoleucine patch superfamily enzyme